MSWMIADPKRLLDHRSHPLSGPDLSTETERFGSFAQQGGQLGSLLWTQLGRCPRSWLMPQSFRSLCFGILSPLAHCALAYSEGCGDVFLFPSLFMQFPGTHPSSFAPIFEECRFLAHPSFYRHSTFFLYFSPLRSIMAQDEGRFGRISRPKRCWAPPGIRPSAPAQVVRESMYVFAAFAPSLGRLVSLVLPTANTAAMNLFLEHLSQTLADYFIVMQVDQAGWHRSRELIIPSNIRLIQQPAYSPEVNPVEHLWEELREKYFHNRLYSSLDLLTDELCRGLNELTDDKERLSSMMSFPHLKVFV